MSQHFDIATIIGVGLLGGSLGLALKTRGLAACVRGVGHRQASLDAARAVGAVDSVHMEVADAVRDADLVVICTPAALVEQMLDEVRRSCAPHAVVTDVASTKARICAHAEATWPSPRRFVGSHPMAGSEKFGPEHAEAELYRGHVVVVEQNSCLDPNARQTVVDLWANVGANVVEMDPVAHDRIVAQTSHVPHILAACIAKLAVNTDDPNRAQVPDLIGPGFRDVTRIAASRPEVWRDICLTNREAIAAGLDAVLADLASVRDAVVAANQDALEAYFRAGQAARREALGE